jgi:hypothetical protein
MSIDVAQIRKDFPILATKMRERPLVYLDTAASAQKPKAVIDAISDFYANHYANIHRGVYQLSADATRRYNAVRSKVAKFIGARDPREIVFVRNATEAVNLVARSWGDAQIGKGDEIVVTTMEHHANIVPWQMLAARKEARLRVATIHEDGTLDVAQLEGLLGPRTRLLAFTHVSNVLGTINPVAEITAMARARGITTLVDGAQGVPHGPVDVAALGCDFYVFSGHKLFGPTGAGVLYGRYAILDAMPPFLGGGDMIERVSFKGTTYARAPERFEGGHAGHRVRRRPRRRDRLPRGHRHGEHCRLRAHAPRPGDRRALEGPRPPDRRHREAEGRRRRLRPRRRPSPRHRDRPRRRGHRDPRGPPLRAAPDGAPRPPRDGPGLLRLLQHRGRDRSTGRGPREDPRAVRLRNGKARGTGIGRSA